MQDPVFVKSAFQKIAPRYVVTNHVLSAGIDIWWRHVTAQQVALRNPKRVLDVASGSGDLAVAVRKRCAGAEVIATDFCEEMLLQARRRGLPDVRVADGLKLPFADEEFDVVTVGFGLRNMASWPGGIREAARVLKPGGLYAVLDFSLPKGWMRKPYLWYMRKLAPRIGGFLTGRRQAFEYLTNTIEAFPSGEAMNALLRENGFSAVRDLRLTGEFARCIWRKNENFPDSRDGSKSSGGRKRRRFAVAYAGGISSLSRPDTRFLGPFG